jgi:hypothetical protein
MADQGGDTDTRPQGISSASRFRATALQGMGEFGQPGFEAGR